VLKLSLKLKSTSNFAATFVSELITDILHKILTPFVFKIQKAIYRRTS